MSRHDIIVYTQPGWLFCNSLKAWLSEKDIDYSERNIAEEDSALEELKNLGVFSTPATLIDNELIIGFDQRKFEELLNPSDET